MTRDRNHVGSRLLAFAGVWLLLSGLLAALSFVVVALVATGVLLAVALSAAAAVLLRRLLTKLRLRTVLVSAKLRLRTVLVSARTALRWTTSRLRPHLRRPRLDVRAATARGRERAPVLLARVLQAYAVAVYRLELRASQAVLAVARVAASLPRVELRTGGGVREARRLNNLGIALAQVGAEEEAVEHLEQARVVLRELGDEEHEAQVIANLGLVHRRQGHSEEAVHLLHEALDKLPPESSAYRRVEEELRTAS